MDNAIILQEVLHHMHKSKKKNGNVVLKLDLEKAYDRIDWDFLDETLLNFGFPGAIVALIMHGITSSCISLLWNGRGLRHRALHHVEVFVKETLSPLISLLCVWSG